MKTDMITIKIDAKQHQVVMGSHSNVVHAVSLGHGEIGLTIIPCSCGQDVQTKRLFGLFKTGEEIPDKYIPKFIGSVVEVTLFSVFSNENDVTHVYELLDREEFMQQLKSTEHRKTVPVFDLEAIKKAQMN